MRAARARLCTPSLAKNVRDVPARGLLADDQALADASVREALGDQDEHLGLADAQAAVRRRGHAVGQDRLLRGVDLGVHQPAEPAVDAALPEVEPPGGTPPRRSRRPRPPARTPSGVKIGARATGSAITEHSRETGGRSSSPRRRRDPARPRSPRAVPAPPGRQEVARRAGLVGAHDPGDRRAVRRRGRPDDVLARAVGEARLPRHGVPDQVEQVGGRRRRSHGVGQRRQERLAHPRNGGSVAVAAAVRRSSSAARPTNARRAASDRRSEIVRDTSGPLWLEAPADDPVPRREWWGGGPGKLPPPRRRRPPLGGLLAMDPAGTAPASES